MIIDQKKERAEALKHSAACALDIAFAAYYACAYSAPAECEGALVGPLAAAIFLQLPK